MAGAFGDPGEARQSLAHAPRCGYGGLMKMTVDVHAELLARAKRHTKETGQPLRAGVEDGLRRVIDAPSRRRPALTDFRVGDPTPPGQLATRSWPVPRELIHDDAKAR